MHMKFGSRSEAGCIEIPLCSVKRWCTIYRSEKCKLKMDDDDTMHDGSILVMGNLMLDMISLVDEAYLKSFDLLPDTIQTAEVKHMKIYEEIGARQEDHVKFSPGVGSDQTGKNLVELLQKEGINTKLVQKVDGAPTARCASLLTNGGRARTLVTDLGAATKFSHEEFMKNADDGFRRWMENVKLVYVTGYFLKVSAETVIEVVKAAANREIPILLNLNAVWITNLFSKVLIDLLPFVNIVIGNESEVHSLINQLKIKRTASVELFKSVTETNDDVSKLGIHICSKLKANGGKERLVVITRGENPVICTDSKGGIKEFPVNRQDTILDTTGAGDGFVGGFIAAYTKNMEVDKCIACGIFAAGEVLKTYGFNLPTHIPQEFSFSL